MYFRFTGNFYVEGNKPIYNHDIKLVKGLVCRQMIAETKMNLEITECIVHLHSKEQIVDLFIHVNQIQPGYFRTKTSDLGNYY